MNYKKKKVRGALLLILSCVCLQASAADDPLSAEGDKSSVLLDMNLNGSLRGSYWNISSNSDGRDNPGIVELWLKAAPKPSENSALLLEGWTRAPDVANSAGRQSALREGYVNYTDGPADLRIGKQIIVWGRADQINPTDNLTPRDNTLFIPESDDQRLGTVAAKATWNFPGVAATAILLPRFRPNVQPISPATGVVFDESLPGGNQYALKLEQSGQGMDWSLSYFRGFDLNPDISIQSALPGALTLSMQHHRIRVLGADAATVMGRYGVRAEVAYTWTKDAAGGDPYVKNPFFYGVLGADRTFLEYLNINLQYYVRKTSNFSDPDTIADPLVRGVAIQQSIFSSQQDKLQQGMSLRIANKWLHEALDAEIAAVYDFTRKDYLLRPKVGYAFDDHWNGRLGATLFRGDPDTFFGMLRDRSAIFGEMRYSF